MNTIKLRRWIYSAFLFYTYVILFFYLIYVEARFPYHKYDWISIWRKVIPFVLCSAMICLQTHAVLSMDKREGILFCAIHILEVLAIDLLYVKSVYSQGGWHFPLIAQPPYPEMLLVCLIICLVITVMKKAKTDKDS